MMPEFAVFEDSESNVRSYCRSFPAKFEKAAGSKLFDVGGKEWLDFLSGAGSLNYGHNHPAMRKKLLEYIDGGGIVNSLDFYTTAKEEFIRLFKECILVPRGLDYKMQFCGPTGTNSVEAAVKLAKKVTGRKGVVSFSNSYHGMSAGSMSVSASFKKRNEEYLNPNWVTFLPFSGFSGLDNEFEFIRTMLTSPGSGIAKPAAFIVELVQGEGGINVAAPEWVKAICGLAKELGALVIVDEIQSGCGRTGKFFSFEHYGIQPDLVCLSKSISGYGIPMSLLLMKADLDQWDPGEHNGTFRGFNYGFITGAETLRLFWCGRAFEEDLKDVAGILGNRLQGFCRTYPGVVAGYRALGMFAGLVMNDASTARKVQEACFDSGLILETCGPDGNVVKFLPPINISHEDLSAGLNLLDRVLARVG